MVIKHPFYPPDPCSREKKHTHDLRAFHSTTDSTDLTFGWKPIPSEARVTRDEVSGLKHDEETCLEDSTKQIKTEQTKYQ